MTYRQKREAQLEELARRAFEHHAVDTIGEGRWVVRRPGTGIYLAEVVALFGGKLMIHGDIEPVVVAGHNSDNPAVLVRWVSQLKGGYFAEKVNSGMRMPGISHVDDQEAAVLDLLEYQKEDAEDDGEGSVAYIDALSAARSGDLEEARGIIGRDVQDGWEFAGSIGRVLAPRLFYAREACRTLMRLTEGAPQ